MKVAAENNVTCINTDVCIDCEVRDSVTLQLMFRGETINCTHNSSSNYISQIHDKRVSVHKTYSTDSNGTSLLKCSVRMNTEGLPTNVLLPINCLNVDIGTSSNNSFMVSQGT